MSLESVQCGADVVKSSEGYIVSPVVAWGWLSAGLDEPEREPWQVWPLGFDPVVYQVWTVTQREPLRVGVPAGSIWLDIDAAYDEAAMIETLHALIPPTP